MRRPPLLSLSVKVGLMLFVVVAGALAIVYAAVVPQLESRVVDAKVAELRRSAPAVARRIGDEPNFFAQESEVVGLGESLNLRVVLRPFFVPQTRRLPGLASAALRAAERTGPLARLALRARFTYVIAAMR